MARKKRENWQFRAVVLVTSRINIRANSKKDLWKALDAIQDGSFDGSVEGHVRELADQRVWIASESVQPNEDRNG